MRIWTFLLLAAVVSGIAIREARAQRGEVSKAGTVSARPTGIEVTNPLTDRKLPDPVDPEIATLAAGYLKEHDANANGVLDGDELKDIKSENRTLDTNKDAILTLNEIKLGFHRRFTGQRLVAAVAAEKLARKLIAFEFVVIERSTTEAAKGTDKAPTADELLKLEKDGKVSVQRYKLAALENVEARLQLGEDAPFVSGRTVSGGRGGFGGAAQESVTYNSLGTTITLTAETEADGKILASINLARSTVAAPPKTPEKTDGQDTGVSANYPRRLSGTIVTTVRLAPGEPAVIAAQQSHTGTSPGELWVLVSAKVE